MLASKNGHAEVAQLLLGEQALDINKADDYGQTALHMAAEKGNSEVVQLILEHKDVDINKADKNMRTALHLASSEGHIEVAQLLVEEEEMISINKIDNNGNMAIHYAAEYGHTNIAKLLLNEEGTAINIENVHGETPLVSASCHGNSEVAKLLLLEDDIDINKATKQNGKTALHCASSSGQSEIVKLLIGRPEIDINQEYQGETALRAASGQKHQEIVQLLLEHPKTNVTKGIMPDGNSSIIIANLIFEEDVEVMNTTHKIIVASLLGNTAQVTTILQTYETVVNKLDSFHRAPLFWASTRGHTEITKLLLSQDQILVNTGKSTNNGTALYQASRYGTLEIIGILLEYPTIAVNSATLDRKTPLMVASVNGYSEVVERLLSVVIIDVNYATFDGKTALIYAVSAKHHVVLELLLRCPQVDTNLMDEEYKTAHDRAKEMKDTRYSKSFDSRGTLQIIKGHTCCSSTINRGLHTAVTNGKLMWIKRFLVCPQIDINVRNKDGYTPLNLATEKGLKKMVDIFLNDARIDVNKPNSGGKQNALIIASEMGNVDLLRPLLLHPQTFVNEKDANGNTALSVASKKYRSDGIRKYFRIVKLLLRCPKTKASRENYVNEIEQAVDLISTSVVVNPTCCIKIHQLLLHAARSGDFRAIRGLLECPDSVSKVNVVDKDGRTPLYIASMMGHLQATEVLLNSKHVIVNIGVFLHGGTAFSIASQNSHFEVMRAIIQNGQSDEVKGWCSDNWVIHRKLCRVNEYPQIETTPKPSTIPPPGK